MNDALAFPDVEDEGPCHGLIPYKPRLKCTEFVWGLTAWVVL